MRTSRHDGLPRPSLRSLLAMTECVVIASLKGVAIHWASVTEPHPPYAHLETRWIPASLASLPPRNDRVCCHREPERRGDQLVLGKRTASPVGALRDTMDCRVTLFLAMTEQRTDGDSPCTWFRPECPSRRGHGHRRGGSGGLGNGRLTWCGRFRRGEGWWPACRARARGPW